MKTIFCFSVFFLLIFTDICSAAATQTGFAKKHATKTGFPHLNATKTGFPHLNATKTGIPNLQAAEKGDCSKCSKHERPMDCAELMENGVTDSGVHTIYPRARLSSCQSIEVYCDMETQGGGWTVIQRRGQYGNGEDYFVKNWKSYKEGFGNMKQEFWLGNDKIYSITNQGQYAVRFEMKHENGNSIFAHYENFWIENEEAKFKLGLSEYSGTAGDAISDHHGTPFYSIDQPNKEPNQELLRSGGWWLNRRKTSSLNGLNLYKSPKVASGDGINWWTYGKLFEFSLETTEIKVRPKRFH